LAVVDLVLGGDVVAALARLALESDGDALVVPGHAIAPVDSLRGRTAPGRGFLYLMILVTRPAPTVRPPSRMAKRSPSSMAIGWINSTFISVLSPGMHISVPSGKVTCPVTSVVRK